ncbi:MAG TPA: PilZ domain-containing protein [Pyrinomonadaceae bacterium]|nr:PilZ domain-containing protein [Pyrinomonadaceae bacterium]
MASAWETISSDRRREPRYKLSLRASVSVIEPGAEESRLATVLAHTRDVSKGGLSLVIPDASLGSHSLGEGSHDVLVVVVLPAGDSVKLEGRLAYCIPLKADEPVAGCLAGILITALGPEDRAAYYDFIDSL